MHRINILVMSIYTRIMQLNCSHETCSRETLPNRLYINLSGHITMWPDKLIYNRLGRDLVRYKFWARVQVMDELARQQRAFVSSHSDNWMSEYNYESRQTDWPTSRKRWTCAFWQYLADTTFTECLNSQIHVHSFYSFGQLKDLR